MGKQSTRENKNIYQLCREAQGLTRERASENNINIELLNAEITEKGSSLRKSRKTQPILIV